MKNSPLLVIILLTAIFFSCSSPSGSSDAVSENILPDIATKVVNGKTIPDTILGFKIGMSSDEVHQVAAKRGMKEEYLVVTWE